MACAKGVVLALVSSGESRDAVLAPRLGEPVEAPRQYLVHVGLVADVPKDAVERGLEHVVEGHGQVDHPAMGAWQRVAEVLGHELHGRPMLGRPVRDAWKASRGR